MMSNRGLGNKLYSMYRMGHYAANNVFNDTKNIHYMRLNERT